MPRRGRKARSCSPYVLWAIPLSRSSRQDFTHHVARKPWYQITDMRAHAGKPSNRLVFHRRGASLMLSSDLAGLHIRAGTMAPALCVDAPCHHHDGEDSGPTCG
ncbi:hypothetical protein HBI26_133890 [Parastagonospora nodorum]|nr:hypothetical protein HBH50_122840 [Parastagonospora nodorum]KAH4085643.1 hypothetical protein HBH48_152320 [Parastagonospora nodorum]KAH5577763.1 hypothetical protein HBI26_133890 [Parastagonospora nodorum]